LALHLTPAPFKNTDKKIDIKDLSETKINQCSISLQSYNIAHNVDAQGGKVEKQKSTIRKSVLQNSNSISTRLVVIQFRGDSNSITNKPPLKPAIQITGITQFQLQLNYVIAI